MPKLKEEFKVGQKIHMLSEYLGEVILEPYRITKVGRVYLSIRSEQFSDSEFKFVNPYAEDTLYRGLIKQQVLNRVD